MLVRPRSPFSRKFSDDAMENTESKEDLISEQRHIENCQKLTAHIMEKCGQHITNLTVTSLVSYRTQEEFAMLIDTSLRLCPNVKHLKIVGGVPYTSEPEKAMVNKIWPYNQFLVKLTIVQHSTELDASPTVNSLISQISGQLRELHVPKWESTYAQYQWRDLRKLTVDTVNSIKCFKSIEALDAVNLKSLTLGLFGVEKGLTCLMQVLNHFPELEDLKLAFSWNYKISEHEVISQYPSDMSNLPAIKRLTIKTGLYDSITYSILAYFPYLEYLYVSYGWNERLDSGNNTESSGWGNITIDKENPEDGLHIATEKRRKNELVDIREYLYQDRNNIRKSNVWKILPFLRKITIGNCFDYYKMRPQSFVREC